MIAGITGHRELGDKEKIHWVVKIIEDIININNISYGFTCLAAGADELFAEQLREKNINYTAIIPCLDYDTTFETKDLNNFIRSRAKAFSIIELNNNKPSQRAFSEAGKLVVDSIEILVAVWDGKKARGLGGTGDIVEYAKSKSKKIVHLNPLTKTKKYINYG